MEILYELLFSVGISVLVSFLFVELVSIVSSSDATANDAVLYPRTDVIDTSLSPQKKHFTVNDRQDNKSFTTLQKIDNKGIESLDYKEFSTQNNFTEVKGSISEPLSEQQVVFIESCKINTCRESSTQSSCGHVSDLGEIENKSVKEEVRRSESSSNDEGEGLFDDWEGVQRSELEKLFGDAVVFVGAKSNVDRVSGIESGMKLELYGLNKIALEGPCLQPQPMALQVSARAKWNAWQRLGNMSREVAMEQYISLLSISIRGWMGGDSSKERRIEDSC